MKKKSSRNAFWVQGFVSLFVFNLISSEVLAANLNYMPSLVGYILDENSNDINVSEKSIDDFKNTFVGKFRSGISEYSSGAIALKEGVVDTMFVSASNTVFGIGERSIPELKQAGVKADLHGAQIIQRDVSIKNRIPVGDFSQTPTDYQILSMWVYNDWLWVFYAFYYDAAGTREDNVAVLTNVNDLANSPVYGGFRAGTPVNGTVIDAQYVTKGVAPIPRVNRSELDNHTHTLFSSQELAIASRLPIGHSLYTFDAVEWVAVVQNAINTSTNNMASQAAKNTANSAILPVTRRFSHTNTNRITQDWLNYGGASGGVNNDLFTEKSIPGAGFIYPGTNQVFYLGRSGGHTPNTSNPIKGYFDGADVFGTIAYKGNYQISNANVTALTGNATFENNVGQVFDGYAVYISQDVDEFYWIYDLGDILSATNLYDPSPSTYGPFVGNVPREGIPLDHFPHSVSPETANGITRMTWSDDGKTAYFLRSYTTGELDGFPEGDAIISKHVFE